MFEIGWSELMLIGIVALIVIGPKELPSVLRTVGRTVTKLRRMAGEFQGQFQEALREADIADMRKEITDITDTARSSFTSAGAGEMFDPLKSIRDEIRATVESAAKPAAPAADTAAVPKGEGGADSPPAAHAAPAEIAAPRDPLVPLPSDDPLPPPAFADLPSAEPVPAPSAAPTTSQQ